MNQHKKPTRAEYADFIVSLAKRLGCGVELWEIAAAIGNLQSEVDQAKEAATEKPAQKP